MRTRLSIPIALAGATILLGSALGPLLAKGPGDPEAPITLRLLVQDAQGRQSEPAALDLQRLAAEISGDAIRIEPTFAQGGDVLGPVGSGEVELGMVPSRDAGDHGVTSLDVLEAPFLIDNDALALAVATSDIADRALAGLEAIGVTGLSMWPEDLRHLFAMDASGRTFRVPEDVADADVFVPAGPVGRELVPTLGGRLYWEDGKGSGDLVGAKDADAQSGALEGMITGLWGAGLPFTTTTVAGDLVVFSKYQMLVANRDLLADLSDRQRELLDAIVDAAHEAALDRHFTERELALARCTEGHTVIEAGPEALAAWKKAAQPLIDALTADPLTAELMADVGYLAADTAPSPGAGTCEPADVTASVYPLSDPTGTFGTLPPDGRYRAEVLFEDLVARGADPGWARDNAGVMTWTFDDGSVEQALDGAFTGCRGRAVSRDGAFVSLFTDAGQPCGLELSVVWRPLATGIEFVLVAPEEPWEPDDFRNIQAHLEGREWLRLDGPMPSLDVTAGAGDFIGDRLPPDGTYRAEMTLEGLVEHGAARQYAGANAGTWTWSFADGTWSAEHGRERCNGAIWVEDGAIHADERFDGGCGMEYVFRWREAGEGIEVQLVGLTGLEPLTGQQLANESAFLERAWTRVVGGSGSEPSPAAFIGDRAPPAGTYRVNLTVDDMVEAGATRDFAGRNAGVWDWTFTADAWSATNGRDRCGASMRVADGHVELLDNPTDPCTFAYDLRWRSEGDGLRFEVVDLNWVQATPQMLADERAMTERVWTRVADAPAPSEDATLSPAATRSEMPEPGVWRIEQTVESLQALGMDEPEATAAAGVITITFDGETYALEAIQGPDQATAACGGPYLLQGDRVQLQQAMNPGACGTLPIALMWTASGPDRAIVDLPGLRDPGYRVLAGEWRRVADAPAPSEDATGFVGDRLPPDGVYRVDLTEADLVARGADHVFATSNAGVWTWTQVGDRWTMTYSVTGAVCSGDALIVGGVVRSTDDPTSRGCSGAADWRWRSVGEDIETQFMPSGGESPQDLLNYRAFNDRVWSRIGDAPADP